jgi:hypothetical protein
MGVWCIFIGIEWKSVCGMYKNDLILIIFGKYEYVEGYTGIQFER